MGAAVQLFSHLERPYGAAFTDEHGEFKFVGLFPDVYSIRVTLASFVPALERDILVQPGMRSILNVNLNNLFSTIQFAYPPAGQWDFMTDDWKWVLRSAASTRPVLRFANSANPLAKSAHASVFSDTRGMVEGFGGRGRAAYRHRQRSRPGHRFRAGHLAVREQYAAGERQRGIRIADRRAHRRIPDQLQPRTWRAVPRKSP